MLRTRINYVLLRTIEKQSFTALHQVDYFEMLQHTKLTKVIYFSLYARAYLCLFSLALTQFATDIAVSNYELFILCAFTFTHLAIATQIKRKRFEFLAYLYPVYLIQLFGFSTAGYNFSTSYNVAIEQTIQTGLGSISISLLPALSILLVALARHQLRTQEDNKKSVSNWLHAPVNRVSYQF